MPRDHRRLPPLSVLRSLPAFKLFRRGRGERAKTTERYSGTCSILASFPDGMLLRLEDWLFSDSGDKEEGYRAGEERIRTLFKSHVDLYLGM